MGLKKIISICFQLPAWFILVGGLIVSIYAYINKIQDVTLFTPIFLLIVNILYIVGRWFMRDEEEYEEEED
jgi:flagellar biosynthesis protein FliQ